MGRRLPDGRLTRDHRPYSTGLRGAIVTLVMRISGRPYSLDVVSIDAIADPALVVDTFGIVVSCNNEAARLLGCTPGQTLGRHCAAVVRGTLPTGELVCTADCPLVQGWGLQPGPPAVEMLIPGTGARAKRRPVVVHHIPVKDVQGRASGVMHLFKPHGESPPDGENTVRCLMEIATPGNYLG